MPGAPPAVVGWDIGGVQLKAAVVAAGGTPADARIAVRPFEVWRGRQRLSDVLREVAAELGGVDPDVPMALTMTAELSDAFRSKREGVLFVLDAIRAAFPRNPVFGFDHHGKFVPSEAARARPLDLAATNWIASALLLATHVDDCILMDVGSTTTDIVPIRAGRLVAEGDTDLSRLTAGELVYTGVLRSNPNTLTTTVPVGGRPCRVADEHFAIMADVYVLQGRLDPTGYTCRTPDGRGTTPAACAERLARLVCADLEALGMPTVTRMAAYVAERQLQAIGGGLAQVLSRWEGSAGRPEDGGPKSSDKASRRGPEDRPRPARESVSVAPAGAGAFLAEEVARRAGLAVLEPGRVWGGEGVALPAVAAARLLSAHLAGGSR